MRSWILQQSPCDTKNCSLISKYLACWVIIQATNQRIIGSPHTYKTHGWSRRIEWDISSGLIFTTMVEEKRPEETLHFICAYHCSSELYGKRVDKTVESTFRFAGIIQLHEPTSWQTSRRSERLRFVIGRRFSYLLALMPSRHLVVEWSFSVFQPQSTRKSQAAQTTRPLLAQQSSRLSPCPQGFLFSVLSSSWLFPWLVFLSVDAFRQSWTFSRTRHCRPTAATRFSLCYRLLRDTSFFRCA